MAEMELRVFRQSVQVGYFDVDVRLRMSPMSYWRVLQNAAAGHATLLSAATEELRKSGQTWMLSKMRVDIDRHPTIGEDLTVETWPSTRIKGARAFRDFVLKDASDAICVRASSLWVIVDLASRRPVRIPDAIVDLRIDPGYDIPALLEGNLPVPADNSPQTIFRAVWSDADQNEHVNNVTTIRWAVDALPLEFLETHELVSAEAHYRAEINIGDEVRVLTERDGLSVRQAIFRQDVLAAQVATTWRASDAAPVTP